MESKEQHEVYEKARKRVKQKKRLYYHFLLFLVGSIFLIVLNIIFKVGEQFGEWFKYAVAAWLFIWILHFVNVFIANRFFGKDWERIETEKILTKHSKKVIALEKHVLKEEQLKAESEQYNTEKKNLNQ